MSDKWNVTITGIQSNDGNNITFDNILLLTRSESFVKSLKKRIDKSIILRKAIVKTKIRIALIDPQFIEGEYYINIYTGFKWKCVSVAGQNALMREITKVKAKRKKKINITSADNYNDWEVYTSDLASLFKKKEYKTHLYSNMINGNN